MMPTNEELRKLHELWARVIRRAANNDEFELSIRKFHSDTATGACYDTTMDYPIKDDDVKLGWDLIQWVTENFPKG